MSSEEKIICLSKMKITLLILCSIIFVFLGVWLLSLDVQNIENSRKYNSPILIDGIGIVSIMFSALCGWIGIKKFFDQSPGLILNSDGIFDNSSGVSAGMVPWSEVIDITETQIQKQKFISIHVQDPEKYANNGNALKRMANRANIKMCGTPINISAISLKIDYEELFEIIQEYYLNSRNKP